MIRAQKALAGAIHKTQQNTLKLNETYFGFDRSVMRTGIEVLDI